jgi:hypothetical protein
MAHDLYDGDIGRMANEINSFLQSVSSDLKPLDQALIPEEVDVVPDEYIIYPHEVERKLAAVNPHKSSGPDDIPNWFLREFSVWLAEPVCAIFNASIREGIVPLDWKLANVVPVPKVHPPRTISKDLRPISLTPTLSKLIESFVGQWIMDSIVDKLDTRQFGCLKGKSTTHELVDILHHWHEALDKEQSVRTLFIDYAKAFDHVDHSIVICKLRDFGVNNVLLRWMCSFLLDRQQRVKLSDVLSDWLLLTGSMPQGSYLGPLTFITLINDLTANCLVHKFVDDTTLTELLSKGVASQMDLRLAEIQDWSATNLMNINYSKTKEMLLGSVNNNPPPVLSCSGNVIERVTAFKLLGVIVDDKLRWDNHVDSICAKASSRLYFLKQLKRSSAGADDLLHFYLTVIRPVLEYACPAWSTSLTQDQINRIDRIQKRAMLIIYGANYKEACNNVSPLCERREQLCQRFFKDMFNESSCLHYLLPEPRNSEVINRLRNPRRYIAGTSRTSRFEKSFLIYGLNNYTA